VVVQRVIWGPIVAVAGTAAAIGIGLGAVLAVMGRGVVPQDGVELRRLADEVERLRAEHSQCALAAREPTRPEPNSPEQVPAPAVDGDGTPPWLAELASREGTQLLPLVAGEAAPGATGYAIWSPSGSVVVVSASFLPVGTREALYRARVALSDGSTVWVGDVTASARGSLLVTISLPEGDRRRVSAIDLYRDPPGTAALTARLRP
jgi:hypothetical protein